MLETRHFIGGMNQDNEDRLLQEGEYRYALNVRNGSSEDSDIGAITNTLGNELVTYALPGGTNKVIGAFEDKKGNRVFYFLYNSNNRHQILEYSIVTNSVALVLDSGFLNFNPEFPIWHIDLVDDDILKWTDDNNEPSNITVARAKATPGEPEGYPDPFTRQHLDVIKYPPLCPPKGTYQTITTKTQNTLKGRLYQIKYKYVYPDGEESVWSPISKIILPVEGQYLEQPIDENNSIKIAIDSGNEFVKKIIVAARENSGIANTQIGNLGDFFEIKTFDKQRDGVSSFNPSYQFDWGNDSIYSSIDLNDSNKLFDRVPRKSATQTYIENRMVYTNNLVNYDPAPDFNMAATSVLTDITAGDTGASLASITSECFGCEMLTGGFGDLVTINPTVTQGDFFSITYTGGYYNTGGAVTFTITAGEFDTPDTIADAFILAINTQFSDPGGVGADAATQTFVIFGVSSSFGSNQFLIHQATVTSVSVVNTTSTATDGNLGGFKRGAQHEFGIIYSDVKGRVMAVQVHEDSSVYVPFYDITPSGVAQIEIKVHSIPPIWATKWQIVYTKNQSVDRFIQYTCNQVSGGGTGVVRFRLQNLINEGAANENFVLSYDFSKGDRVRFIRATGGAMYQEPLDVEILKFDQGTGWVDISEPLYADGNIVGVSPGNLFEIYTPKKSVENKFYFEIGECYDVIDPGTSIRRHGVRPGAHQIPSIISGPFTTGTPATVLLEEGDVYYKLRTMPTTEIPLGARVPYVVEDYNYSDFYNSNSISIGRVNVIDEGQKETRLEATAFVSEVFVPDTNINGLCSFYGFAIEVGMQVRAKEYDKRFGSVQRMYSDNKEILLFQELKVGRAFVNESVIFDQAGVPQIAKSNEILSDIVYIDGEYGIGKQPGSFAVYGKTKYFADIHRGSVCMIKQNQIQEISEIGMHNYFTDTFKEISSIGQPFLLGVYDVKFDEYVLHIQKQVPLQF